MLDKVVDTSFEELAFVVSFDIQLGTKVADTDLDTFVEVQVVAFALHTVLAVAVVVVVVVVVDMIVDKMVVNKEKDNRYSFYQKFDTNLVEFVGMLVIVFAVHLTGNQMDIKAVNTD